MNHLTQAQLTELQHMLLEEKRDLEHRFEINDNFGLADSMRGSIGELSAYDNHPADIGTEVYERGKDISLNEHAEMMLDEVNQALDLMAEGRYGTCDSCGQPIPFERLQAIPTTHFCRDHSPSRENTYRRPVEEKLLHPPFGRTSLDEHEGQNQFDGEDAWQIVESWGNSDSPAMAENPDLDYDNLYIEADENEGYVEPIESFLATDIYGKEVTVIRNREYEKYMLEGEGDHGLEPEPKDQ